MDKLKEYWALVACIAVQLVALALFGFQFYATVIGSTLRTTWFFRELAELSAMTALTLGTAASIYLLFRAKRRETHMRNQLDAASARFQEVIVAQFNHWGFTGTETEIGLLLIKGLSISQIADLRSRSQATIKAQNSSIYQKSGLANRNQLVSYFVKELTSGL